MRVFKQYLYSHYIICTYMYIWRCYITLNQVVNINGVKNKKKSSHANIAGVAIIWEDFNQVMITLKVLLKILRDNLIKL